MLVDDVRGGQKDALAIDFQQRRRAEMRRLEILFDGVDRGDATTEMVAACIT
jgi:hypothetical protein